MIEFSHNGTTYVYDFDLLCCEQTEVAQSIYHFRQQQLQSPPRSLPDYLGAGAGRFMSTALAWLLRKKEGETVEEFDSMKVSETERFINRLPSADFARLRDEVQADFFDRAGIVDIVSLQQSLAISQEISAAVSALTPGVRARLGTLLGSTMSGSDSSPVESSGDELTTPETAPSSGVSPETTPSD